MENLKEENIRESSRVERGTVMESLDGMMEQSTKENGKLMKGLMAKCDLRMDL